MTLGTWLLAGLVPRQILTKNIIRRFLRLSSCPNDPALGILGFQSVNPALEVGGGTLDLRFHDARVGVQEAGRHLGHQLFLGVDLAAIIANRVHALVLSRDFRARRDEWPVLCASSWKSVL